jgi:hypothetical protein
MVDLIGEEPTTSSMEMNAVKAFCYQMLPNWKRRTLQVLEEMVDLVGIEPTTSSMPWKLRIRILLTAKTLIVGRVGRNR